MTKTKIRIPDDPELRSILDQEYEDASHIQLCKYALMLAAHILELINYSSSDIETIKEGFLINELWQQGSASIHDVRQTSFRIHQMARASENAAVCAALRVAGHAVAAAHMRQHAMVASDYAVKVISLLHPDCLEEVRKERLWQIHHLREIKKKIHPSSYEDTFVFEMTPSNPAEEADSLEEVILTPSLPDEKIRNADLILEGGDIFKAEEITFEGEKESESRIAEAMSAYDKAMDQAADINW